MFTRLLKLPDRTFFLLGPRGTGKLNFDFDTERVLRFGLLPQIHADPDYAVDTLETYVSNYLREEIQQEALVRQLDSFARFLHVASVMNGQVANVTGIARDAAVARPTVQGYFETLADTLIGFWLPAWQQRAKVKEAAKPKFYLFDPGAARALAGHVREPLETAEQGPLLETWVLHELRAAIAFQNLGGELSYWRTPSGSEVDFIWTRGRRAIGIEVKASTRWRTEFAAPLQSLIAGRNIQSGFGVYTGASELRDGGVRILPLKTFLRQLSAGSILG